MNTKTIINTITISCFIRILLVISIYASQFFKCFFAKLDASSEMDGAASELHPNEYCIIPSEL